jgi:hypothetical protein
MFRSVNQLVGLGFGAVYVLGPASLLGVGVGVAADRGATRRGGGE